MALSKEELKGLYVGQDLCIAKINHRHGQREEPSLCSVTKIGKKYFYVNDFRESRFELESGKHDNGEYSASAEIYFDMATYEQDREAKLLWGKYRDLSVRMHNKPPHLTTEMVKELIEILTPPTEE
jgi:hypothetical protein